MTEEILLRLDEKLDILNSVVSSNTALINSNRVLIENQRDLVVLILSGLGAMLLSFFVYFINKK